MRLKWPNDVWFADRKIGGVLVELKAEADGAPRSSSAWASICGYLPRRAARSRPGERGLAALQDACPATPVAQHAGSGAPRRAFEYAAGLRAPKALRRFGPSGWRSMRSAGASGARARWRRAASQGIARGVDDDGALLLEHGGRMHKFVSGEASLRLSEGDA